MNWLEIAKFLGTSTIFLTAVGFVIKSIASHFLNRDLESLKNKIKSESDQRVQELKGAQDKALQGMREAQEERMEELRQQHTRVLQQIQAEAGERIEHVKAALQRLERLEGELLKSRDTAYGEIWQLSKCVNLFGPTVPVECSAVSRTLTDWYFSKGRLLTQNCRQIYFTIQEMLNYYDARCISPTRPPAEVLYCSHERPVDVLIRLEAERLGIPPKGNLGTYSRSELEGYVDNFKAQSESITGKGGDAENAWLLLHFLMSTLRNRLGHELGWRKDLQSSSMDEIDEAAAPAVRDNGAPVVSSLGAQHIS